MKNNIKTVCGIEKYDELSKRKGFSQSTSFLLVRFKCITKGYRKKENDKGRINLVSELFYTPHRVSSTTNPSHFL